MPALLLPIKSPTLLKALAVLASVYPADEYPEKAKLIVKKAHNPVLVYDEETATLRGLTTSGVVVDVPLTGATITGSDTFADQLIEIEPAATIAALTIDIEKADNVPIGAVKRFTFSQIVTALTMAANGSGGTIKGAAITAAAVNTSIAYQKSASQTWRRLY